MEILQPMLTNLDSVVVSKNCKHIPEGRSVNISFVSMMQVISQEISQNNNYCGRLQRRVFLGTTSQCHSNNNKVDSGARMF